MATSDSKPDPKPAEDPSAELRKEIAAIRADLAALTHTLGQVGKGRAEAASDQAANLTREVADEALKMLRGFRETLGKVEGEAEQSLRAHPNQWMGGLLGVLGLGILFGLLLRHRD